MEELKKESFKERKKIKYYYENGLPFNELHARNLDALKKRVLEDNKGGVVIISGLVGGGKTTSAIHFADYINGAYKKEGHKYKLIPENFVNIENVISTGTKNLKHKLIKTFDDGKHVLIWDEAGDFNNRSFLTSLNQDINRMFEVSRAFKIVVFLCLPNFYTLDKNIFHVGVIQGVLVVTNRNKYRVRFKVFDTEKSYKLMAVMGKVLDKLKVIRSWNPNYYGEILPLKPERQKDLDTYSILGKKAIILNLFSKDKNIRNDIRGGQIISIKES